MLLDFDSCDKCKGASNFVYGYANVMSVRIGSARGFVCLEMPFLSWEILEAHTAIHLPVLESTNIYTPECSIVWVGMQVR